MPKAYFKVRNAYGKHRRWGFYVGGLPRRVAWPEGLLPELP